MTLTPIEIMVWVAAFSKRIGGDRNARIDAAFAVCKLGRVQHPVCAADTSTAREVYFAQCDQLADEMFAAVVAENARQAEVEGK